ncbi:MAG: BamA/TamA family outer membrane protein, partial [Gemmatimonadetes bacterium]|nr:BamA/TamA family outer membrane protein [Gemmatimonadota bacterium]
PDRAEVERRPDGALDVSLFDRRADGGPAATAPYFRRRFDPRDTREVRIYLRGGDDRVVVRGEGNRRITLRVIGGGGNDALDDSSRAGHSLFYDADRSDRASGRGVRIDRRPYAWDSTQADPTPTPPRDWTSWRRPVVWMSFSPDVGLLVGGGAAAYRYGFRQRPYASRRTLRAAYATAAQRFGLEYSGEVHRPNSGVYHTLQIRLSGIEVLRFYGFGNETGSSQAAEFYRVAQEQYSFQPDLHVPVAPHLTFSVGSMLTWVRTPAREGFIATLRPRPYGVGDFGQWGWRAGVRFDSRDVPAAPTRGLLLSVQGSVVPALFDVKTPFGAVQGEAATVLSAPSASRLTLALRAGGRKVFGTYPFHEAAFLGGPAPVRGWPRERFAGDASLYGNAELRLHLTRFFLLLPGAAGVSAFADVGRVFYAGESSREWHGSGGGGLWFAFLSPANTVSLTVARSEERTAVYARAGFPF